MLNAKAQRLEVQVLRHLLGRICVVGYDCCSFVTLFRSPTWHVDSAHGPAQGLVIIIALDIYIRPPERPLHSNNDPLYSIANAAW